MVFEEEVQRYSEERKHRFWSALVGLSLILLTLVFCFTAYQIITPEPRELDAGLGESYTDNVPKRFAVEQLAVSEWAERRMNVSEDIVFVMRDSDGTWYALLGVDMRTGCFLHWDEEIAMYASPSDLQCLETYYTPYGQHYDSMPTSEPPKPMARLRVELREGRVVVLDSLLR